MQIYTPRKQACKQTVIRKKSDHLQENQSIFFKLVTPFLKNLQCNMNTRKHNTIHCNTVCKSWCFPGGSGGKEHTYQCRRCRFDPWFRKITWRRKQQPTPVFLHGKIHGQRNLVSSWGHKELDTTENTHTYTNTHDTYYN